MTIELADTNSSLTQDQALEIVVVAITHVSCHDGAGAAWTIDNHFRTLNSTQYKYRYVIQHHRVNPGKADQFIDQTIINEVSVDKSIKESRLVFSADVGYDGCDMDALISIYPNIIILDHHISSYRSALEHYYFKYLKKHHNIDITGQLVDDVEKRTVSSYLCTLDDNLPNTSEFRKYLPLHYHFDNNESGTTLTWKYFHHDQPVPMTLQYIRERDLFTWANPMLTSLPNAEELTAGLYELISNNPQHNDWTEWDRFIENETENLIEALKIGKILCKIMRQDVWRLYNNVIPFQIMWGGKVCNGAAVNTTKYISDAGNFIVSRRNDKKEYIYDFCMLWHYNTDGTFSCSFRSRKNGFDCSAFTKYFKGGGHQPAAGCTLDNVFQLIGKSFQYSDKCNKINSLIRPIIKDDELDDDYSGSDESDEADGADGTSKSDINA